MARTEIALSVADKPGGPRRCVLMTVLELASHDATVSAAVERARELGYADVEPFIEREPPEPLPINQHRLYEQLVRFECDLSNDPKARADIRDVRQTMYIAFEECDWRARRHAAESSNRTQARLEHARRELARVAAAAYRVARAHNVPGVPRMEASRV